MGAQDGFDFAQLDAEAAQLHLEVGAAEVLQLAVGAPAHAVSGAVEAGAGSAAEGVRDEALGGERGPVQVAARHADAADEELAGHADGDGLEVGVEDEDAHVGKRASERWSGAIRDAGSEGGADGGFGGAVDVEEGSAGGPPGHQLGGAGLTAGDDGAQRVQSFRWQGGEGGGRQGEDVDVLLFQQSRQRGAGLQCFIGSKAEGGAGEQRGNGLPDEGVEAGRGELEHARAGPQPLWLHLASREVGHAPVGHHDSLGLAGAAGGVDDVREPLHAGQRRRRRGGLTGELLRECIHLQHQHPVRRWHIERRVRQQQRRGAVLQHEGQPSRGIGGVHGDEGATGLEHGEHRHHPLGRARKAQGDTRFRAHAMGTQHVGQRVGASVELRVREHRGFEAHRLRIRRVPCLRLEQLVDAGAVREGLVPATPVHEHLPLLLGGQQRQHRHRPGGVLADGREQGPEMPRHALDGGGVEQVGGVVEAAAEALRRLLQREVQVEPRRHGVRKEREQPQSGKLQRGHGRVQQAEAGLVQRRLVEASLRAELLDELREGHVLVLVGGERGLPHLLQQREERSARVDASAQGQVVDEEADEPFGPRVIPAGDGRADDEVVLSGVAVQQDLEGGQQRHERRRALPPREGLELLGEVRGDSHGHEGATRGRHGGTGPVGGQLQRVRHAVQPLPPPRELPVQHLAFEPAALPDGVVRVLDREGRERRRLAPHEGGVERRDFAHQHAQGPAVEDDVVQREQQHVLGVAEAQQHGAQQGARGEVEGAQGFFTREATGLLSGVGA